MGIFLMMLATVAVFAFRDSQLLALGQAKVVNYRLLLYASCLAIYTFALGHFVLTPWPDEILTLVQGAPICLAFLALHSVYWAACVWMKRHEKYRLAWLMALAPAPLLLLTLQLLSFSIGPFKSHRQLQTLCLALLWSGGIGVLVRWIRRSPIQFQDPDWSVSFGGWANLLALFFVPFDRVFSSMSQWLEAVKPYLLSD